MNKSLCKDINIISIIGIFVYEKQKKNFQYHTERAPNNCLYLPSSSFNRLIDIFSFCDFLRKYKANTRAKTEIWWNLKMFLREE
jgi:hypothetical protein